MKRAWVWACWALLGFAVTLFALAASVAPHVTLAGRLAIIGGIATGVAFILVAVLDFMDDGR